MESSVKRANPIGGLVTDELRGIRYFMYLIYQICVCDYEIHRMSTCKVHMHVVFAFFLVACSIQSFDISRSLVKSYTYA